MFLFFCLLVERSGIIHLAAGIPRAFGDRRCRAAFPEKKKPERQRAFSSLCVRGCADPVRPVAVRGSLTVEAALIFSLILILLAGLMLKSAQLMVKVESAAGKYAAEGVRYTEGLRPEDLIHIGSFIQEWIPRKN